jgi:hypothetical protein
MARMSFPEFHEVKLRKTKPRSGLVRTRTALAKARAHWFNMGAFTGASAMPHLLIYSLRLLLFARGMDAIGASSDSSSHYLLRM